MTTDNSAKLTQINTATAESEALAGRLQEMLRQLAAPQSIRNAVVAVEKGDDSFRWRDAAGDAHPDGTPMAADTPIWIASVTKLYIASSILKLYARDLLRLGA